MEEPQPEGPAKISRNPIGGSISDVQTVPRAASIDFGAVAVAAEGRRRGGPRAERRSRRRERGGAGSVLRGEVPCRGSSAGTGDRVVRVSPRPARDDGACVRRDPGACRPAGAADRSVRGQPAAGQRVDGRGQPQVSRRPVSARHRPARPRRTDAVDVRRARVARGRVGLGADRRPARPGDWRRRRTLRRMGREAVDAPGRRDPELPDPAARDRGPCGDPAERDLDQHHRRRRIRGLPCSRRLLTGGDAARARLRARRPDGGRQARPDPRAPHRAARDAERDRVQHARRRDRDPTRGGTQLRRSRDPPADPVVGQHDRRRPDLLDHRCVAGAAPRPRDHVRDARLLPGRGRDARRAGSDARALGPGPPGGIG